MLTNGVFGFHVSIALKVPLANLMQPTTSESGYIEKVHSKINVQTSNP